MILQYLTTFLKVFSIPKALILAPLFDHFFDPIFGPPFEEPFGPPWSPKVPTLPPHVDFGPFLGPPLGSKMGPWSAHGRPREPKKLVPRVTWEVPFASWIRLVRQRGPESHSYRLWVPLGWPRVPFGTPLGVIRLVLGHLTDTRHDFRRISGFKHPHVNTFIEFSTSSNRLKGSDSMDWPGGMREATE